MEDHFDLVITGTGFASSFFLKKALEYLGPSSRILVLERGKRFPHHERLAKKIQNIPLGNPYAPTTYSTDSDKIWIFDPSFGGSSNCWTGCTPRFMPSDFELNKHYGVGQDWPLSYDELIPYYEEAEELMQIGGPRNTPWPMKKPYPLPPQKLSTIDLLLEKEYGVNYISQPTARATMPSGIRAQCCTSSVCNLCPVNSKYTIENSLAHIYDDPRVTVKFESQVVYLNLEGSVATDVVFLESGIERKVGCDSVILGANAIFNAHILLQSSDKNSHTGKGICEQVGKFVKVYYDGLKNVGGSSIITANGFMMYDGEHRRDRAACLIESFNTPFIRNEPGKWRDMSVFKFIYEDLPQEHNRVTISTDITKPEIIYNGHSDYTRRGINHLEEDFNRYFSFLPIERYEIDSENQETEYHICSTTRMSSNPETGVIDKGMIHHNYRNVVVLGSGAFPAISPANPTLTLCALALMAADSYFSHSIKS